MRFRTARRVGVLFALVAAAVMLPGAGQSHIPPESDGSTYMWLGAAVMNVDVKPWGGGYVRSTPYLIDCPMACIRPWDQGREITLTAHPTSGHKFESWEGACAGQGNPCTLKASGSLVDVRAVFSGQFVPPTPPPAPAAPPAPPVQVNPQLAASVAAGACPQCFTATLTGTGYNPNSPIDILLVYSAPDVGAFGEDDIETSDAAGSWMQGFVENCEFDFGTHHGPVEIDVTATDAQGASASAHVSGTCP
jgi:hypothetical protein